MSYNIDVHIGSKIRTRRHVLGMSQSDLGNRIGVTFQQIQKYEKGFNKIVASRLYDLTIIMSVPITYFFDGFIENNTHHHNNNDLSLCEESKEFIHEDSEGPTGREAMALVKLYNGINNKNVRKKLVAFLKTIASE